MIGTEVYRIKKGNLKSKILSIPIDFGIVYSINGKISTDLYVNETYIFNDLMENDIYFETIFDLDCLTEYNEELRIDLLSFRSVNPSISKIVLESNGKMQHSQKKWLDSQTQNGDFLHYLELEGLLMEFTDFTERNNFRNGKNITPVFNKKRDNTSVTLKLEELMYDFTFYKSSTDDGIIIVECLEDCNNKIPYSKFLSIKNTFVSIMTLINGAEVRIRKEFTGGHYSIGKIDSEIKIEYSFNKINNSRYNSYIPINNPFERGELILHNFFMFCFDNYKIWNDRLDLDTIIYYISNSQQTKSVQEKVFIQTIAFERLTTKYLEYNNTSEEFVPAKDEFEPIKKELIDVLARHKEAFGIHYNSVKSKLSNLNQIKGASTKDKMYRLLLDVEIEIDENIEKFIDSLRNKTVHKGDIGEGDEANISFYLLEELLIEIILRLIKYKGKRNNSLLKLKSI